MQPPPHPEPMPARKARPYRGEWGGDRGVALAAQDEGVPPQTAPAQLHDVRHLWLKGGLLAVWALVTFGANYFARELQALRLGDWTLAYWMASQGSLLVFMVLVVVYAWAMNRFEARDAALASEGGGEPGPSAHKASPAPPAAGPGNGGRG